MQPDLALWVLSVKSCFRNKGITILQCKETLKVKGSGAKGYRTLPQVTLSSTVNLSIDPIHIPGLLLLEDVVII